MGTTYRKNQVSGRRQAKITNYPITIGNGVTNWGRFNTTPTVETYDLNTKESLGITTAISFIDSAIDANGDIHVIYISSNELYYRNNIGGTWTAATTLLPAPDAALATIIIGNETPDPYVHVFYVDSNLKDVLHKAIKVDQTGVWLGPHTIYAGGGPDVYSSVSACIEPGTSILNVCYVISGGANSGSWVYRRGTVYPNAVAGASTTEVITTAGHANQQLVVDSTDNVYLISTNSSNQGVYVYDATASDSVTKTVTATATKIFGGLKSAFIGDSDVLHMLYDDKTANGLVLAQLDSPYSGTVTETTIYSYDAGSASCRGSITQDTNGFLHIACYDENITSLIYASDESGSFITSVIDPNVTDSVSHIPFVFTNGSFKYFIYYDDVAGATPTPRAYLTVIGTAERIIYDLSYSLDQAIASLPSSGGQIEILAGDFVLTQDLDITTSNLKITGQGNSSNIKMAAENNRITVSADYVTIEKLQFTSITQIVSTLPMLELTASTSANCTVQEVTFTGAGAFINDVDIEWTIADGHIVNNNISTTTSSGLGGI